MEDRFSLSLDLVKHCAYKELVDIFRDATEICVCIIMMKYLLYNASKYYIKWR
jgi:hypothetical protein